MNPDLTIPRRTFLLDTASDIANIGPTVVIVWRDTDGQVRLHTSQDHRDAEKFESIVTDSGATVLMRLEGEYDHGTGTASVWV